MISFALIRHGPTSWNAESRIQGHTDIPLSEVGRQWVRSWRIPEPLAGVDWISSSLVRARETAALLTGRDDVPADDRLREASWGDWEGKTHDQVSMLLGRPLDRRGLDFRPPGGESLLDLFARVRPVLAALTRPTAVVCHGGVLKAVYAVATGWDMHGDAPDRLLDGHAHLYEMTGDHIHLKRVNLPLVRTMP
ncbi:hypothetical protein JCM17960_22380 [Magnetospira thiophila]